MLHAVPGWNPGLRECWASALSAELHPQSQDFFFSCLVFNFLFLKTSFSSYLKIGESRSMLRKCDSELMRENSDECSKRAEQQPRASLSAEGAAGHLVRTLL